MTKRILLGTLFLIFISLSLFSQEVEEDEFLALRESLAYELFPENDPQINRYREAFINVQREDFINSDYRSMSYRDMPFPQEKGVLQPAPSMIASILRESGIQINSRVLIIGRNTEYLSQIVSLLTETLYVADPLISIREGLGYNLKNDLSYFSWVEEGPFNTIILFGSVKDIPQSLVSQLDISGKLIVPLEGPKGNQILIKALKYGNGFSLKSIGESYIHRLTISN